MKTRRKLAAVAAAAALLLAACGDDGGGGGGEALDELGEGEGELNIIAWGGYAEDGSTDPAADWVTPFEEATRLPDQRQGRQHERRDGSADEHRRVRRRVRIG